jgi:hypothetical protein
MYDNIISLGYNCYPAMFLKKFRLLKESLPFDYLVTVDLKSINKLFENNFEHIWENIRIDHDTVYKAEKLYVIDETYAIKSPHDFNSEHDVETINKYKRRIERLNDIITNKDEILFIRYEEWDSQEDLEILNSIIKSKRPNKNYDILLLHANEIKYKLPPNFKCIKIENPKTIHTNNSELVDILWNIKVKL